MPILLRRDALLCKMSDDGWILAREHTLSILVNWILRFFIMIIVNMIDMLKKNKAMHGTKSNSIAHVIRLVAICVSLTLCFSLYVVVPFVCNLSISCSNKRNKLAKTQRKKTVSMATLVFLNDIIRFALSGKRTARYLSPDITTVSHVLVEMKYVIKHGAKK